MAIEKINAFVLKTIPYRESSGIFYLLTKHHGLVHGIARGIRRKKSSASFLERGFLIETLLYVKPNRELHTMGDAHVINYFPSTRREIVKSAMRDAAFETILAAVSVGFPSPELYFVVTRFMTLLENQTCNNPRLLWSFYREFSSSLGFGLDCNDCITCSKNLLNFSTSYLLIDKGGFVCKDCAQGKDVRNMIPSSVLAGLTLEVYGELLNNITVIESRRITRLFASYCHYHCEKVLEHKALDFLDIVLAEDNQFMAV
ncbi:MAG TPA: DNA repair protein RecO [Fibrobacteres bacterium]|jgi:DNA repair protein RecO (recombination protein O)|nr:DNA repair protein RecO [Fibrobacterota bacterium]